MSPFERAARKAKRNSARRQRAKEAMATRAALKSATRRLRASRSVIFEDDGSIRP